MYSTTFDMLGILKNEREELSVELQLLKNHPCSPLVTNLCNPGCNSIAFLCAFA